MSLRSLVCAAAWLAASALVAQEAPPPPGEMPARSGARHPDPAMAIHDPDRYAWTLFTALNRPAGRGSRDAVWETWIEQEDVYADPTRPPVWDVARNSRKSLNPHLLRMIAYGLEERIANDVFHGGPAPFVADAIQEVRLNRPAFDFIVENDLWYQEGVLAAATQGRVRFPLESIIVKATWKAIREQDKDRYHWQINGTELVGMMAWGLMTKDLPMWFWATFEHVDNTGRSDVTGSLDSFGSVPAYQPPNRLLDQGYPPGRLTPECLELFAETGLGGAWKNYRLKGTQTAFTDATGRPTILGNSVQEAGQINTSSCMTCHARAAINAGVKLNPVPEPGPVPNQFPNPFKSLKPALGYVGTPDRRWFFEDHSAGPAGPYPLIYPVDFLWELALLPRIREDRGKAGEREKSR